MLWRPKLKAMNLQPDSNGEQKPLDADRSARTREASLQPDTKSQQELLESCPMVLRCDLAPPGLEYQAEGPLVWEEQQPSEKLRQMLQEATPAQREQAIEIASKLLARRICRVPTMG